MPYTPSIPTLRRWENKKKSTYEGKEPLEERSDLTSHLLRHHLAVEHGHYDRSTAKAKPSNNTSNIECGKRVRVDGLDNNTDDENQRG